MLGIWSKKGEGGRGGKVSADCSLSLVPPRYYCRIKGCCAVCELTAKECTLVVVQANAGAVDKTAPIPISRAARSRGSVPGRGDPPTILYCPPTPPSPCNVLHNNLQYAGFSALRIYNLEYSCLQIWPPVYNETCVKENLHI